MDHRAYEHHFSYVFIFEASLNSVHFPLLVYTTLLPQNDMTISPH